MQLTPTTAINRGTRQRKLIDKNKVIELAESIAANGLLHAIVCMQQGNTLRLVAGDRRLHAIELLYSADRLFSFNGAIVPAGQVPYVLITERTEIALL